MTVAVSEQKRTRVAARSGTQRTLKKIASLWQLYLLISVPTAFLIVFNYIPMVGVQIAFRNYNPLQGIWGSQWIGAQEFAQFFQSPYFWPVIQNTLVLGIYSLAIGTPATIILALLLNEVKHGWLKKVVQTTTFVPFFISTVVLVGMLDIFCPLPPVSMVSWRACSAICTRRTFWVIPTLLPPSTSGPGSGKQRVMAL